MYIHKDVYHSFVQFDMKVVSQKVNLIYCCMFSSQLVDFSLSQLRMYLSEGPCDLGGLPACQYVLGIYKCTVYTVC